MVVIVGCLIGRLVSLVVWLVVFVGWLVGLFRWLSGWFPLVGWFTGSLVGPPTQDQLAPVPLQCTLVPNIRGPSVLNLLRVTAVATGILSCFPEFQFQLSSLCVLYLYRSVQQLTLLCIRVRVHTPYRNIPVHSHQDIALRVSF